MTNLNTIRGQDGVYDDIVGTDGNDAIDGGLGADRMAGGKGNDSYYVDDANDVVDETGGDGIDTIYSSRDISLRNGKSFLGQIENLVLTSDKYLRAEGNDLDNVMRGEGTGRFMMSGFGGNDHLIGGHDSDYLSGGAGHDRLDGREGSDYMNGGTGDDTYVVDNTGDMVVDGLGGGNDTVESWISFDLTNTNIRVQGDIENLTLLGSADLYGLGNYLDNVMTGNAGANSLYGFAGNDRLDGGKDGKADFLAGGSGNDTYVIGEADDIIEEREGEGTDTVEASISYKLAATLENLVLTGHDNIDGRGNNGNNVITGNDGDNKLDGGRGADVMKGGAGDDRYVVDDARDIVDETDGHGHDSGGLDTVRSSVSFSLVESDTVHGSFENLTLYGTDNIDAAGNDLDNRISGNDGNNSINGGLGNDILFGGWGSDDFVFDTALGKDNVDKILDFGFGGNDRIGLDHAIFTALTPGEFTESNLLNFTSGGATTADQHLLYNSKTGQLFYDEDGAGGKEAILFAQLDRGLTLHASDFYVM